MKQESELGRLFRDHYIVNLSLTNGVYDPSQFYGRATQLDRSLKSAIAFVQGLYPPASPNEVVAIVTDTPAAGILHPSESWCAELGDAVSTLVNSTAFVDFFASFTQKHRKTFEKVIGNWEPSKVKKFCSWSLITKCSGHSVPPELTDDVQNDCLKFVTSWLVDQCAGKFTGIAAAPLLREMFRIADDRIALATEARFVLLSSHDSAIAAVLPVLGLKVDAIPVRSHLVLELWEIASDVFCRFVFNGAPVSLAWLGGSSLVRYANLKAALAESGVLNHCRVPEWK
jgi:acid phosphatase